MDDSDLMIIEPPKVSYTLINLTNTIYFQRKTIEVSGVPKSFAKDDGRRFSFGVGARKSLSQPVLSTLEDLNEFHSVFSPFLFFSYIFIHCRILIMNQLLCQHK